MAYLNQDDPHIIEDIAKRKEFAVFKTQDESEIQTSTVPVGNTVFTRENIETTIDTSYHLELYGHQRFISRFINPNTFNKTALLKYDPGSGKTISVIVAALEYVKVLRQTQSVGSVIIIGFTRKLFAQELLSYAEFSFISKREIREREQLRTAALSGNIGDITQLNNYKKRLKRRLTNRRGNGYFLFYGYKELANAIFHGVSVDVSTLSYEQIREMVVNGEIRLNPDIVTKFKDSLIICDEIHVVYNLAERNIWGISLQLLFDMFPDNPKMLLSATPVDNSPTEIVDLVNLLNPGKHLIRSDFFAGNRLKSDAIRRLSELMRGKVSYLQDLDQSDYPKINAIGEAIPDVDYLRFTRCIMSTLQENTFDTVRSNVAHIAKLSGIELQYISDIVYPNPDSNSIGIYRRADLSKIINAPKAWLKTNKIEILRNNQITGDWLRLENIGKYSGKYRELIDLLLRLNKKQSKIFIFHRYLQFSGGHLLAEILSRNGFISETGYATPATLCAICGEPQNKHKQGGIEKNKNKIKKKNKIKNKIKEKNKIKNSSEIEEKSSEIEDENSEIEEKIKNKNNSEIKENNSEIEDESSDLEEKIKNKNNSEIEDEKSKIEYIKNENDDDENDDDENDENENDENENDENENDVFADLIEIDNDKIPIDFPCESGDCDTIFADGGRDTASHVFMPARFVLLSGEISNDIIERHLEKFNNANNATGKYIKIIVGTEKMGVSFTLKAVQHQIILSRPDSISEYIQIRGRVVRKRSHNALPPENRVANIYTFVASRKDKTHLSDEETKYKTKVEEFKIIQQIDRDIIHANAVDLCNNPTASDAEKHDPLAALPLDTRKFCDKVTKKLVTSTFDAFYQDDEINETIYRIKQLFMESPVWKFNDLVDAIHGLKRNAYNAEMISTESVKIALYLLTQEGNFIPKTSEMGFVDFLLNPYYKYVNIAGRTYTLVRNADMYIMAPYDDNAYVSQEIPFRTMIREDNAVLDVNAYIKTKKDVNAFNTRFTRFMARYKSANLEELNTAFNEYDRKFHAVVAETAIEYIFNDIITKKAEHVSQSQRAFYYKMVGYYAVFNLVVFASSITPSIQQLYGTLFGKTSTTDNLEKTLKESECSWCPKTVAKIFYDLIDIAKHEAKNATKRVSTSLIPIGHVILDIPRFYAPKSRWVNVPEYARYRAHVENDVIVGYDEKISNGLTTIFKLRVPIDQSQTIGTKDARLIRRGMACSTRSKVELIEIAKQLDITYHESPNIATLCHDIRARLITLELLERKNDTNKKWFYQFYEKQPSLI